MSRHHPYYPLPHEEILYSISIKSKMAVISMIDMADRDMLTFKIASLVQLDNGKPAIKTNSDGRAEIVEYFCDDLERAALIADVIRTGRPIPRAIPYRIDPETGLALSGTPRSKIVKSYKYEARREVSWYSSSKQYNRTLKLRPRPDYGFAIQLDITVKNLTTEEESCATFDLPEVEAMVAFSIIARRLKKLLD